MRIDKRLPFGFLGEWGKVYKLHNTDVKVEEYEELEWGKYCNVKYENSKFSNKIYFDFSVEFQSYSTSYYMYRLQNGLNIQAYITGNSAEISLVAPFGRLQTLATINDEKRHTIELNLKFTSSGFLQEYNWKYDNGAIQQGTSGIGRSFTLNGLIIVNGDKDGQQMFEGKIYKTKLDDVELVVVKRKSDNAIGFYDKVKNIFYKASGYYTAIGGEATGEIYTGTEIQSGIIAYQKSYYRDIGQDVQFKCAGGKQIGETPAVKNLLTHSESKFIETSDAWFDGHQYKCVVDTGDIVKYENEYWVVESLQQEEIYTPQEHSIWKIAIKRVYGVE